jgi:hypothetical protein
MFIRHKCANRWKRFINAASLGGMPPTVFRRISSRIAKKLRTFPRLKKTQLNYNLSCTFKKHALKIHATT